MPKLKTHKGAAARFHMTGTGKLLRMKRNRSHLRRKKPANVRRQYKQKLSVSKGTARQVNRLTPGVLR